MTRIAAIHAREILSGIGRPTVEVVLTTGVGESVTASSPSGTSRGRHEARELYDGGERLGGMGVRRAVANVNDTIAPVLVGRELAAPAAIDEALAELDGTEGFKRLGSNGVLAVSMAVWRAAAKAAGHPLYRTVGEPSAHRLPAVLATVLAGGKHSPSPLPFEDYLLVLDGFSAFHEALEALVEARLALAVRLRERFGPVPDVGGALAPPLAETPAAFDLMLQAVEDAGAAGKVRLGLDVAASDLYDESADAYRLGERTMSVEELRQHYVELAGGRPLTFIEDAFHEDDFAAHAALTAALTGVQVVGDDLFATNRARLRTGIDAGACDTILLKINQAGTMARACDCAALARDAGYKIAVSIRSSDTNDDFIADLAVALAAEQIKLGSPVRGERNAKYNRLLAIEAELGDGATFASRPAKC